MIIAKLVVGKYVLHKKVMSYFFVFHKLYFSTFPTRFPARLFQLNFPARKLQKHNQFII